MRRPVRRRLRSSPSVRPAGQKLDELTFELLYSLAPTGHGGTDDLASLEGSSSSCSPLSSPS
jgi:hypothetical protein